MKILFRHNKQEKWDHIKHTRYSGEAHLRDILFEDPDIIPIEDLSAGADLSQVKLMLKEVGLPGSGSTDLVGIGKNGNIIIIETKLATNPDAKRAVIGQILEYAAFMHKREVEWLDEIVRREKNGKGIMEHFEGEPDWDSEMFGEKLRENLQEGTFTLFIVVDEMNPDLEQTINYMNEVLGVRIYALELKYFQEKSGIEILVPNVHGGEKQVISKPPIKWTEASFFEYAKKQVDAATLQTLRKLYDFSKQLGNVDFGSGKSIGTFRVSLQYKGGNVRILYVSPVPSQTWFPFSVMIQKGVDEQLVLTYIRQLISLGFPFDEAKAITSQPTFDISILNDDEKFSAFEKYTLELKEKLRNQ
jgi:hypothetical protein